jgi:hypothetical protein
LRVTVRVSARSILSTDQTLGRSGTDHRGKSRSIQPHGAGLILHVDLAGKEQNAIFAVDGTAPEFSPADTDLCDGGRDRNVFAAQIFQPTCREAERSLCRRQQNVADALVGIEHVAVDHDARVLAERENRVVAKCHLQMTVGAGLELVVHVHGGAVGRARALAA